MGAPTHAAATSTLALGTDAVSGDPTLTLTIADGGAPFTHQFDIAATGATFDNTTMPGFITVSDDSGAVHFAGSAAGDALQYATYGSRVSAGTATSGGYGSFAGGTLTPTAAMPVTGSASYSGGANGLLNVGDGNLNNLFGTMAATANFGGASPSVNGTMNLNVQGDSVANATNSGFWNTVTFSGGIAGNHFAGTASSPLVAADATHVLATAAMTGATSGAFFGPQANNLAGVFNLSGGLSSAVGAYGGLSQGIH